MRKMSLLSSHEDEKHPKNDLQFLFLCSVAFLTLIKTRALFLSVSVIEIEKSLSTLFCHTEPTHQETSLRFLFFVFSLHRVREQHIRQAHDTTGTCSLDENQLPSERQSQLGESRSGRPTFRSFL
jgi:hypothetical protein